MVLGEGAVSYERGTPVTQIPNSLPLPGVDYGGRGGGRDKMTEGEGAVARYPRPLQGYLAHKKQCSPRELSQDHVWGPMAALVGGVFFNSVEPM